jgi:hypothetical protein
LDFDAEYSVMLTREDGVKEMVCAVRPTQFEDLEDDVVVVFATNTSSQVNVKVAESAQVRVWSSVGLLVGEFFINEGETILNLDDNSGIYILEFILADGSRQIKRIIL